MDKLLEKIWAYVARDQEVTMRERLYRLICLLVAIICIFIILPINTLQRLPIVVNIADVSLGLFSLYCYRQAQRGRNYFVAYFFVTIGLLDLVWFPNAGSQGSITLYFFVAVILPLVLARGLMRWGLVAFLVVNVCGLYIVEYFFPQLSTPFLAPVDRLMDLLSGLFCGLMASALILWAVITNYDRQHDQLELFSRNLSASEKNYRELVENVRVAILRLDRKGWVTFLNHYAEDLFGYPRQEIVGKDAFGLIFPARPSQPTDATDTVKVLLRMAGEKTPCENETLCRDGRRIWISWISQPIYDDRNELVEILCVGNDITERKALLEQLQLTQWTMDTAAVPILWTDAGAQVIYANVAASDMLGYANEELKTLRMYDLVVNFTEAEWGQRWDTLKRDRAATFEAGQRRKNGALFPAEITLTYLKVGEREYSAAFVRDITERKRIEERRQNEEQQKRHVQKLESLGVLAGGIAHDFNNLLTAILGNLSLARMELKSGSEVSELLSAAEKSATRARSLTLQLLTFSKGGRPIKSAVSMVKVIQESVDTVLRDLPVQCQIQPQPQLWQVEADEGQLGQVFNNLLTNAHQAMPNGGMILVDVANRPIGSSDGLLLPPGNYVQVTLCDQGTGIQEAHLQKIFDPYFTTKAAGGGLGLAVVFSIIKSHHGQIYVQSKVGVGTTFTILLPAAMQSDVAPEVLAEPCRVPSRVNSVRILVMDDEEVLRIVAARMLRRMGYEVECASDGKMALAMYKEALAANRPFDVVIMDLMVPAGMGGKELMQRLREIDPQARGIVSSGYSNDPIMSDYKKHGFSAVMAKPYTLPVVQAMITQIFNENGGERK